MASELDLTHSLTLHPHPFQLHTHLAESSTPRSCSPSRRVASSTSFEPTTPSADELDAVPRHGTVLIARPRKTQDLEDQRAPRYNQENDPYSLSTGLKSAGEIRAMDPASSRTRDVCTPALGCASARKAKKLQSFYERQNENIERLLKPVDEHRREAREEQGENHLKFKIAVNGSFVANVLLAVLQIYAAVSSRSLSLFTTMADAIFDPLSNVTLILSNRAVNRVDPRQYPSGKARIETAGNIVFCFLMCSVSFVLIALSARDLADGSGATTNDFHLPSVVAVAVAFTTKLALFLYCWALRHTYSQVGILWQDHRNDLIINGFGLVTSVAGSKIHWWIDPAGAIVISCLIATLWMRTAFTEFQLLIGVTANTQMQQLITYISMTHSSMISQIDTVRAFHSGPRIIVEVDIVMDPDATLRDTHDVAEALQTKLESLPDVERAYVHVDYETTHRPEHFLKKEL
ncbi:MAG: hypothetical protein M1838_004986 [Thelocarpon superellum]|nr:MAG: hypothetical protein M1838_004986 [Thelocarpon superellum]